MNKFYMKIQWLFLLIGLSSCSYFSKPITRTPLYKEVIYHYKNEACNKEKKKAALYLFEYMDSKYSCCDSMAESSVDILYDSIKLSKNVLERKDKIKILIDNAPKSHDAKIAKDVSIMKSSYLIKHIDITYDAWKKLAKVSGASYQDYCDYILPYRVSNEKYEVCNTEKFNKEYYQFTDSLLNVDSAIPVFSSFIKSLDCQLDLSLNKYYQNIFSPKQIDQVRMAPRCDDNVIYLALVFRSLGIPASYDYLPQWGTHYYSGHSWLSVKWQNNWYAFDAYDGSFLNEMYRYEGIPKVFRRKYSSIENNNAVDVTNQYVDAVNLKLKMDTVPDYKSYFPAIAVFNKFSGFKVVDKGIRKGSDFVFKNLGRRVVYFVGGIRNKKFKPLINPFFVDSCGLIKYLNPDDKKLKTRYFYRKYPLTTSRLHKEKLGWASSLSGSWFEGSNDEFNTCDTLIKLENYNSYKEEFYKIEGKKSYKAIRLCCGSHDQIASLKFFDEERNILNGHVLHDLWKGFNPKGLFDDNKLTWVWVGNNRRTVSVGYVFDKLQSISEIAIQARNDGNQIVVGDEYQLLVYDKVWKNLGSKIATKQELVFNNVPSGGYFWLRNLSNGTEEVPFMFDAQDNQYWAGQ